MIKANELRIGNIVYYLSYDEDAGGNKIGENEIETVNLAMLLEIEGSPERFEGIPLIPEILEKVGLKKGSGVGDRNVFYSTGAHQIQMQILSNDRDSGGSLLIGAEKFKPPAYCKYLHQLQNLYFILTGQELDVKL